ncbi:MAG: aldehyde dehydrogenase family protein, partial [Cyclobacteriaceae bacterium]|nr:aldehyde dehydrogenase family protein [Cyclobacteriaceae bacterium]
MSKIETISPIDGSIYCSIEEHTLVDVENSLNDARHAFNEWSRISLVERIQYVTKFIEVIENEKDVIAEEITWQMGRPLSQSPWEVNGFVSRARYMLEIAESSLSSYRPAEIEGFERWIDHEPLGVVTILSPWNYPFLTSVNAIVPALVAGNSVILKHSFQTPLVAERYLKAAQVAGFPKGVFKILHIDHQKTAILTSHKQVDGVFFTGSVEGGFA